MEVNAQSKQDRHRSPVRFGLFTFLLIVTGICVFLAYQVSRRDVEVETSIDLRSHLLRPNNTPRSRTIEFLSRTQFVEPTDDLIVSQVLADPQVSGLMIVQGRTDPAPWLKKNLVWRIDWEREDLQMSMTAPRGQQSQAQKMFDAVTSAFLQHAIVDESVLRELQTTSDRDWAAAHGKLPLLVVLAFAAFSLVGAGGDCYASRPRDGRRAVRSRLCPQLR